MYNLGFIALGPESDAFIDWWWQKTRRDALVDHNRMMFTDQRWVDFVPSFFEHFILKDPTCNVAYWNLHERILTSADACSAWRVNDEPLVLVCQLQLLIFEHLANARSIFLTNNNTH